MATDIAYVHYVCEQIEGVGAVRYKKMFGEYMVYVNDKPLLLICDATVYIKKLAVISDIMKDVAVGTPYLGAKEHYILDIDDASFANQVILLMEPCVAVPKPRKKKM